MAVVRSGVFTNMSALMKLPRPVRELYNGRRYVMSLKLLKFDWVCRRLDRSSRYQVLGSLCFACNLASSNRKRSSMVARCRYSRK